MQDFTVNALVLKENQYGEGDALLSLLSAEKGIITVSAKGVLKMTSKNRSAVQPFCYSEFDICEKGGRYILKSATLKEQFFGIRNEVEKYALACYVADAAFHFCYEENNEEDALRVVLNTLAALCVEHNSKPLWQIKGTFELKLCSVSGFMPELDFCGYCGLPHNGENFSKDRKYVFSVSESTLLCSGCYGKSEAIKNSYNLKIPLAVLSAAKYIASSPIERFLSFRLDTELAGAFSELCERYLLYLAERNFETLKFYKAVISDYIN